MDTNYVNASRIKFDKLKQTFIACQAPLPASFKHFWQMVIEEKVEVIVLVIMLIFMAFLGDRDGHPAAGGQQGEGQPVLA